MKKFSILLLVILLSCSKDDDNQPSPTIVKNPYALQLEDGTVVNDQITINYIEGQKFKILKDNEVLEDFLPEMVSFANLSNEDLIIKMRPVGKSETRIIDESEPFDEELLRIDVRNYKITKDLDFSFDLLYKDEIVLSVKATLEVDFNKKVVLSKLANGYWQNTLYYFMDDKLIARSSPYNATLPSPNNYYTNESFIKAYNHSVYIYEADYLQSVTAFDCMNDFDNEEEYSWVDTEKGRMVSSLEEWYCEYPSYTSFKYNEEGLLQEEIYRNVFDGYNKEYSEFVNQKPKKEYLYLLDEYGGPPFFLEYNFELDYDEQGYLITRKCIEDEELSNYIEYDHTAKSFYLENGEWVADRSLLIRNDVKSNKSSYKYRYFNIIDYEKDNKNRVIHEVYKDHTSATKERVYQYIE